MSNTKRLSHRFARPAFTVLVAVLVFGCGAEVELGDVEGTVTMDGKPLPNATIRFVPVNGGRSALGRTDETGRYTMEYSATASGALVGPMRVEVTTAEEVTDASGNARMKAETVPKRYNTESELRAEVGDSDNTFDFALESK